MIISKNDYFIEVQVIIIYFAIQTIEVTWKTKTTTLH